MRLLATLALFLTLLFGGLAHAEPTATEIRLELIKDLQAKGALTPAAAASATADVLKAAPAQTAASAPLEAPESAKSGWLSWVNLLYVAAVVAFLICFGGIIVKAIKAGWEILTLAPAYVYQAAFGGLTTVGVIAPTVYSDAHPFYVVLFSAFALPMVVAWVLAYYPRIAEFVANLFTLKVPPALIASLYGAGYFAVLAIAWQSQIFGFFTAVCISSAFGFGLYYQPFWKAVVLDIRDNMVGLVIISHTLVLAAYIAAVKLGVPNIQLFAAGFEYYCSIALGLALFIEISPFWKDISGFKLLRALGIIAAANFAYAYFGMHSIGAVIDIFAVLILIDWLVYMSWSTSMILGAGVTGLLLFFTARVFEHHGKAIMALFG